MADPEQETAPPESTLPEPLRAFLERAVSEGATDVHIDEWADTALVRFRVDGVIHVKERLTVGQADRVINQVQVAADLEQEMVHSPVEGHFRADFDKPRNIRATVVPTAVGHHSAHLRLLAGSENWRSIRELGIDESDIDAVEAAMGSPHGLVLAAGLTGAGKTTTLYALATLGEQEKQVIASIEDPVEFDLEGVRQLEVDPAHGLSMHEGLKALLRMDPDILIIGEVRDRLSATTAAQAAMAGRLVLATVHGRDAAAAVESMHYLTVPNYVLGGALRLVIGQGLVRRICPECAKQREPETHERRLFEQAGVDVPETVPEAVGCDACHGYGYSGRTGVFEVVPIDDEAGRWLARGQPQHAVRDRFAEISGGTLTAAALRKAAQGVTSMHETLVLLGADDAREPLEAVASRQSDG